jgi:hypothetical protein
MSLINYLNVFLHKKERRLQIEWSISFFNYVPAKYTYFSLNILRVFPATPKKIVLTYNSQST